MNEDIYMGSIILWPLNWAPEGWEFCDGKLLTVHEYGALYSLIGTTYGGDGYNTFALPNLKGYIAVGKGQAPGRRDYRLGEKFGTYTTSINLTPEMLAKHNHSVTGTCSIPESTFPMSYKVSGDEGERNIPQENDTLSATTAISGRPVNLYGNKLNTKAYLSGIEVTQNPFTLSMFGETGNTGQSYPISVRNVQKSIVMNYIIAVQGLYPPRP